MTVKRKTVLAVLITFFIVFLFQSRAVSQGPQDMKVKARIRAEQHFREERLAEMKEATNELVELTKVLVEEVEAADGYTTSAKLVEGSNRIEELAKKIEDLAKRVKRRAQGR